MNIIGDIAGQYDALIQLMRKLPDHETVFIGDLVDRGPNSPAVIDFAIEHSITALMGNHEHMMIDALDQTGLYLDGVWMANGGNKTFHQYGPRTQATTPLALASDKLTYHLQWLRLLPTFLETDDLIITHAPVYGNQPALSVAKHIPLHCSTSLIWNRDNPVPRDRLQIFGHNGHFYTSPDNYICIDDSANRVLTAYNTVTKQFYRQPF